MNRRWSKRLWALSLLIIVLAGGCEAQKAPEDPAESVASLDKEAFWERLPLPNDAKIIRLVEGVGLGFATGMIEPELFDFYATWLSERGWKRQAPAEAMVTLPHQRWRKDEVELLIEIRGLDEQDRTIIWLQLDDR